MSTKIEMVATMLEGKIDLMIDKPYNVSDIDDRDSDEVDAFFVQEYFPHYNIIKQAMKSESKDDGERYHYNEPSGCTRQYGVFIEDFDKNDIVALISAMRAVDLFGRESCFVAEIEYLKDDERQQGSLFYIARSGTCLVYPNDLATMIAEISSS